MLPVSNIEEWNSNRDLDMGKLRVPDQASSRVGQYWNCTGSKSTPECCILVPFKKYGKFEKNLFDKAIASALVTTYWVILYSTIY
jgi:hypothetical protein